MTNSSTPIYNRARGRSQLIYLFLNRHLKEVNTSPIHSFILKAPSRERSAARLEISSTTEVVGVWQKKVVKLKNCNKLTRHLQLRFIPLGDTVSFAQPLPALWREHPSLKLIALLKSHHPSSEKLQSLRQKSENACSQSETTYFC